MKMKDVDIKIANLEEEVKRLVQKNSQLEGKLGIKTRWINFFKPLSVLSSTNKKRGGHVYEQSEK